MIKSKDDLSNFIDADLKIRGLNQKPFLYQLRKPLLYYTIMLRKAEYYENIRGNIFSSMMSGYLKLRVKRIGMYMGLTIPVNTCDKGLFLVHWGSVIISGNAKVGKNCRIHSCVNIGQFGDGAPSIGNNVYIGPGAKIFGNISIGNNVVIGANSVVNRSFPDDVVIAGVPAKIIKHKSESHNPGKDS